MTLSAHHRTGLTAIEVLAATLLSALLMTALIGVLRGLKAHEQTLTRRAPTMPWQASLDTALAADLSSAVTYQWSPMSLVLHGHGGRDASGASNWLPATIHYEVQQLQNSAWLVRRETPAAGGAPPGPANLVLAGVCDIRLSGVAAPEAPSSFDRLPPSQPSAPPMPTTKPEPLPTELTLELRASPADEPIYQLHFRRL